MTPLDVLLVDDDPGDAMLVEQALADVPGSAVTRHATNMDEAAQMAAQHRPDVVVHDLGLPGTQGLDTVRRGLRDHEGVPFVVLTGLDDTSVAVEAISLGAADFVSKNRLDGPALVRTLRLAVERHRSGEDRAATDSERMIAEASHELRSPVAGARGLLTLLRDRASEMDPETRTELLDRSIAAVDRLGQLTDDLLLLARSGSDGPVRPLTRVQVRDAIDEALEDSYLSRDQLVASVDTSAVAHVHDGTLLHVLRNLFDNAAMHGRPPVEVVSEVHGDRLVLRIRDQGDGIPADRAEDVFEPFVRLRGRSSPGSGLGLSIVRRTLRAVDGDIRIEVPPEGRGTAFVIEVPAAPAA